MSYQSSSAHSVRIFSGHISRVEENLIMELFKYLSAMVAVVTKSKSSVISDILGGVEHFTRATGYQDLPPFSKLKVSECF